MVRRGKQGGAEDEGAPPPDDALAHLDPEARARAAEPAEVRIALLLELDWYLGYTFAGEVLGRLAALFGQGRRLRPDNLLLIGDTNNGKSNILKRFLDDHPKADDPAAAAASHPVLHVQAPSRGDTAQFYLSVLEKLDAPIQEPARLSILEHRAKRIMKAVGVRMLVIDELHDMIAGSSRAQLQLRNTLKQLSNEYGIALVGAGIKDAWHAISSDPQLRNRFEVWRLPTWQQDMECQRLLISFERKLPLRRPSYLDDPEIMAKVLEKVEEGTIGEIARLLKSAARYAIAHGSERITQAALDNCDYQPPSERT